MADYTLPTAAYPDLPILVGVTGHWDLLPSSAIHVEKGMRAALETLSKHPPSQLVLVTALAEGADQLAAQLAIELRIPIAAVLPMPMDRYRATMRKPAGADELRRLWNDVPLALRIELPLIPEFDDPSRQETVQYEQLGLVLSRYSHLVLPVIDFTVIF